MSGVIADVVDTAVGNVHRDDPVLPRTGGPAGNARLTAWLGVLLLLTFLAELFTLLQLHQMLSVHIFIGALLVPVALAKTATTTWRMASYYLGSQPYRRAGPPPLLLRILGPAVVLTTLAVLGTGLALIAAGHDHQVLFLHKATFVLWLAATGAHTLVRAASALVILGNRRQPMRVPGGGLRSALLSVVIAAGVVVGAALLHFSNNWTRDGLRFHH